ncbi:tricorn protease domain 2-containing protein [Trichoderma cornu-damae]|uniref:Tricorn protease domain 2-containing protein n=1 Tax=Trichoderma cornu-damae TaxID=654480 RepID=A0A9P8TYK6_9HYPO|nr:tricorn protease domain 2-containing protein [Trichoderma cornu-damae]
MASITIERILAAAPVTNRGQGTQLSADPKGTRIAYASGKSIFVRSIDDPSDCREYTGHTHPTTVARFAPSGFKIASGDSAGILRIWEPESIDTTRGEYPIISGPLLDIAWDGDSRRIMAVGNGRQKFGKAIMADSGNSVGEIIGHTKSVNAVSITTKRPLRAVTVGDDRNVNFYHGVPFEFKSVTNLHAGFVLGAVYSPDGSAFVTVGQDRRIQLYDGVTGEPLRQIGEGEHAGSIFGVSWSQDGKKLATASADQTVKLWDVESGSVIQTWKFGDGAGGVRDHQVGVVIPHGRTDGLIISINLAGELIYLREGNSEPVRVIQGHDKGITALIASSSDGNAAAVLTGSFDGRVCSWDLETGAATVLDGQSHTNQIAQFAAGSGKVYSVGWDDTLRAIDEPAKTFLGESTKLSGQPKGAASAGHVVYVAGAAGVAAYADGKLLKETPLDFSPEAIAACGSYVAVGGQQNTARIYTSDPSGGLEFKESVSSPLGTITALAFSKDGSHLAAGTSVGKILVFKAGSWELVTDRWSAHTARVTCISWDDTGAYAASGSLDSNVFVWCLEKKLQGQRIKAPNAHLDGVTGIAWIAGGRVASSGKDATVKIWEVNLP